jgi:FtsP/CotA-like multicopper oxidase with cupredoxin domain
MKSVPFRAGLQMKLSLPFLAFLLGCAQLPKDVDPMGGIEPPEYQVTGNLIQVDIDAREAVHEYLPGLRTRVFAYNGQVPGPALRAKVGDTLRVHFRNQLPEPTILHWHGVETEAIRDGSPISQLPVPPGGEESYDLPLHRAGTFWYHAHVNNAFQIEKGLYGSLIVIDPDEDKRYGLPPPRDAILLDDVLLDAQGQVLPFFPPGDKIGALNIMANGRDGESWPLKEGERDLLLVNGTWAQNAQPLRVEEGQPVRLRLVNAANARYFRISLPGHDLLRIGTDGGLLSFPQRLRPVSLESDPIRPAEMVSSASAEEGVLLSPGERQDVIFVPKRPPGSRQSQDGSVVVWLEWHDWARGRHRAHKSPSVDSPYDFLRDVKDGRLPSRKLMPVRIEPSARPPVPLSHFERPLRPIAPAIPPVGSRRIPITLGHTLPDANGEMKFFAQAEMTMAPDPLSGSLQMLMKGIPFLQLTSDKAPSARVGDSVVLEVVNLTMGSHPFHLHGFYFRHLETEFQDEDSPGLNRIVPADDDHRTEKDTLLVPGRTGLRMRSKTITRLLVHLDDPLRRGGLAAYGGGPMHLLPGNDFSQADRERVFAAQRRSGGWLFHCHVLEHASLGMVGYLNVYPGPDQPEEGGLRSIGADSEAIAHR